MRWGVSRGGSVGTTRQNNSHLRRKENQEVLVKQKPGKFVKTYGGKRGVATKDAVATAAVRQVAKKSTTDSLTSKQLKDATSRMQLEVSFNKLNKQLARQTRAQRFIAALPGLKSKVKDISADPMIKQTFDSIIEKAKSSS